jgi:predicted oxidoreductase (fatty acid repression mutant protein)
MKNFLETIEARRSVYGLGQTRKISERRITELVEKALLHSPSAFNSQSGRVVLLFGKESNSFWALTKEILRKIVPEEAFKNTEDKLSSFDAGYGTVLFFEDQAIVTDLMDRFPLYKDNFPVWSLQSNGMLEYVVWTALASEGLGASLQHYNPLVDEEVKQKWKLPGSWKLLAEMPFGSVDKQPDKKEFSPVVERLKVFGL